MRRRDLLAAGAAATCVGSARAEPPPRRLAFRIVRQGSQIGEHVCSFEAEGDRLVVRSDAEIAVKMMGVALFRYRHHGVERWEAGRLAAFESQTDDDGTKFSVAARREPNGLVVTGSAIQRYVAPADAMPMTHWNRAELTAPKINPQKGDLLRPVVSDRGVEQVKLADGASIPARHWNYGGQAILDLWYDNEGRWASLAFLGGDQSQIVLERR